MFRFGTQNLRRLENVAAIDIRPITVLVGRNSSGKSTFLRALPLLRQSITTRTSSPILWYGDWVDFGDFDGSVFDNRTESEITFSFGLDRVVLENVLYGIDDEVYSYGPADSDEDTFENIMLDVSIAKSRLGTRISSISLTEPSNDACFVLKVTEAGDVIHITVNGVDVGRELRDWMLSISTGSILPTTSFTRKVRDGIRASHYEPEPYGHMVRDIIGNLVGGRLDKRITPPTLGRLIVPLLDLGRITKDNLRKVAERTTNRSWGKLLRDISGADRGNLFPKIRTLLLVAKLPLLLNATTRQLRETISSTLYIGPARARSDRYYRYQDLAVSEIDPDGKNFPMFLNSLSEAQIQRFSQWVRSLFGYGVTVIRGAGHISINLVYESSSVNIVDTGYGVSQILPVLGQVWWANNRPQPRAWPRNYSRSPIIAIEQPELHLHPAHQALLAHPIHA
jgi:hypothetical protein